MNTLKDFLKKKTDKLSFIEIKEGSYVDIHGYKIGPEIPLPLIIDELVNEIKENRAQEEVKIASVINGMIYTIGVDEEFKYASCYKEVLYKYDSKIESYILFKGLKLVEAGDLEEGLVYLRSLVQINPNNLLGLYNYALALEEKAKNLLQFDNKKLGKLFLSESTKTFEEIISKEKNFSLAYYKLGFHYKNSKQFKKSQLMWEKFLQLKDNEELIDNVRENLRDIEDDALYEEGYTEILRGEAQKGLEKLLKLRDRYDDWWNLIFVVGLGYRQLGYYAEARYEFERVLELVPDQPDALNELGLCLASLGELREAVEAFSKAITIKPEDYEVICNRGMTYLHMGLIEDAKNDIERAYSINPEDEITVACKKELDKVI